MYTIRRKCRDGRTADPSSRDRQPGLRCCRRAKHLEREQHTTRTNMLHNRMPLWAPVSSAMDPRDIQAADSLCARE